MRRASGEGSDRAPLGIQERSGWGRSALSRWGAPLTIGAFMLSAGVVAGVTVHSWAPELARSPYHYLPYSVATAPPVGDVRRAPEAVPVPLAQQPSQPRDTADGSSSPAPSAAGSGASGGIGASASRDGVFSPVKRPAQVIGLTPGPVSFDPQPVGSTATARTVTVASNGNLPLRVRSVAVSGGNATAFAVTADRCSGVTLNPGNSCPVTVSFTPDTVGTRTASLTISGDGAGSTSTRLTGVATDAVITATGIQVDCGQSSANRCAVDAIYRDLVGRPADSSPLDTYAAQLDSGQTTRQQVAGVVTGTDEWRTRAAAALFKVLLGRTGDQGSIAYYAGQLRSTSVEDVTAGIASTQEYVTRAGATNDAYVAALYRDLLHTPGDPAGRAGWVDQLNRGATKVSVATAIRKSAESQGVIVETAYRELLGRQPTASERTNLANAMVHGLSYQSMLGSLVQTDEYMSQVAPLTLTDAAVASFTDGDPHATAADFTATIDWGDGTQPAPATVRKAKGGGFTVTGTHTYAAHKSWTATIHLTHNGGSQAQTTSTVVV